MEEFAAEIDARVDQWKTILDEKDAEIRELKSRLPQGSINSSISSLPNDDDLERSQINALQRALSERERTLLEVQSQLQLATKEMEESTEILKRLKLDRDQDVKKIKCLNDNVEEMKKTIEGGARTLSKFAGGSSLNEILGSMKKNGQVDLVVKIEELHELKSDNRAKEKQIIALVKACNDLQDTCDTFEEENGALRERLGISDDEPVDLTAYITKQKRRQREWDTLKKTNE
ncbi:hypothetical protein NQ317_018189 [Molorchus minor]|uniref:Uncharacterized protein n=1 Tax=Molorchus minor TaxID=1323400 RepID=A0ABQ9JWS3_9CUCU|nr:hypothetical protein NQ317_018189 [Molorchus minor]